MDSRYRIRPAFMDDVESVVALERSVPHAPHWRVADYVAALLPIEFAPGQAGLGRCFFVAETGNQIIGFAVGRVTVGESEARGELESVAVRDLARRMGIGQALCAAVIVWARGAGVAEVELEVRSKSEGAIALYKGLGFVTEGMRLRYYSEPVDNAVLMLLDLRTEQNQQTGFADPD